MAAWVEPIGQGWVVDSRVPGPDVDEFADASEVIAALTGSAGDSLLAVQHPHRTPRARARGLSLADALPSARQELDRLLAGWYRPVADVVAPYRVDGPDGTAVGVLCLVDPNEVSRVRHSEEVYPRVVAERAAMLTGLGRATSAAMLVPVAGGAWLTETVLRTTTAPPAVHTVDPAGRTHRMWLVGPGPDQDLLLASVRSRPLLVADGNHRLAAAARARVRLLALVTGGPDLRIGAFHRELVGTGLTAADLARSWRGLGLRVWEGVWGLDPGVAPPEDTGVRGLAPRRGPGSAPPEGAAGDRPVPGVVAVRAAGGGLMVELPVPEPGQPLPRIDHTVVEEVLIAGALGVDPEGPHVRPVAAGHPPGPDVDAVFELAPVPFDDVLAVHAQHRLMPRKSTYFTPKPRSGLLLAGLPGAPTEKTT
ncbi:DUF1015 family protein [Amycolatopsis taiwanensis]|uniref:DUF1015 family protein n=1 Tax=Amycolatopsis taiwanensis TaxID=342230 RepID=UPI0004897E5D|nr:DUF1015 family protein [Amycolatopsis taiwanensis]